MRLTIGGIDMLLRKKGFTLMEVSAVMGVAGALSLVSAQESDFESKQMKARALGNEIFQYNSAVSRYISEHAADSSLDGEIKTGSDWLKSNTCGGPTENGDTNFISCSSMPNGKTIQESFSPVTTFEYNSTEGTLQARTVWESGLGIGGNEDSVIMGIAALVASGNYVSQSEDAAAGYQLPTVHCPEMTTLGSSIDTVCGSERGAIVSISTTNASIEPWLRTDHGNTMNHVIEFSQNSGDDPISLTTITDNDDDSTATGWSGAGLRQIVNVSRIYNIGGGGSESLILGKMLKSNIYTETMLTNNSLFTDAVIMDGSAAVMNELYVKADTFLKSNLDVEDNITSGGKINSVGSITSGDDTTNNYSKMKSNGDIIGNRFFDASDGNIDDFDSGGYVIDPTSNSRVNYLEATGNVDIKGMLDVDKDITGRDLIAERSITVKETLTFQDTNSEGDSCTGKKGSLSMDGTGMVLSCQEIGGSQKWVIPGQKGMYSYFNRTSCPTGWVKANGTGNGTIDLRGEFIRAWDNGRGIDSGRKLGSWQNFMIQAHSHDIYGNDRGNNNQKWGVGMWKDDAEGRKGDPKTIRETGGKETRPRNVALLACMKQ